MTAFLSWVFAQANKVYDWFGNTYYAAKNAVENAWNWAVSQANAALSAARTYAYNLLQQAQGGITNAIGWLQSQIASIRAGIYEDITALTDWVNWKVSQIGSFASDVFWDAINAANSFIVSIRDEISAWVRGSVQSIYDFIGQSFGWVVDLRDNIIRLLAVLTPNLLQSILNFFTSGINTVLTFIANPLDFILDIITPKFISFLCFVLAWALGTTINELPNKPTWKG